MNFNKRYFERNKIIGLMRYSNRTGSHSGCVRIFPNNSLEHEMAKLEVVYYLMNRGYECWTEVIFNNNSRADILVISPDSKSYIIEILHTETIKELNEKIKKYPKELEVIPVKTPFDKDDFIL